jgi:hypothetical protein
VVNLTSGRDRSGVAAVPAPRLTGATVYLPNAAELVGVGVAPTVVVTVKNGDKLTRYCGFPTVIHHELSAIELAGPDLTVREA